MVPPLRRLSSIAYGVQLAAASRTTTKSTANRPSAPCSASRRADRGRVLGDQLRVGGVGREDAAQIALPARAAEQLVVGREQLDHAAGQDAQLDAGAAQLVARRCAPRRCRRPRRTSRGRRRTASSRTRAASPRAARRTAVPLVGRSRRGRPARSTRALPCSGDALVELDDRPGASRALGAHLARSRRRSRRGCAGPRRRAGTARRPRRTAAGSRSCAEVGQPRVGAVHRDAEAQRDVALELGGVVGDQVDRARFGISARDPARAAGAASSSFSLSERGRGVADRDQRQPGPGVARDDARQQRQVVLDDRRRDRHRGHVDHPQPRLAQQQQQEQEPLLVGLRQGAAARRRPGRG